MEEKGYHLAPTLAAQSTIEQPSMSITCWGISTSNTSEYWIRSTYIPNDKDWAFRNDALSQRGTTTGIIWGNRYGATYFYDQPDHIKTKINFLKSIGIISGNFTSKSIKYGQYPKNDPFGIFKK